MQRTEFLKRGFSTLLGATAIFPILEACATQTVDPVSTTTSTTTGSTNGSSASNCAVTPTETEGPYPTKVSTKFVRKDITDGRTGVATTFDITIKNGTGSCAPLVGAIVDVWHCDKDGNYSEYSSGVTGLDFLRGRQTTDATGLASFGSIFPGWYGGRAPHIHVHVFTAAGRSLLITQIAFPFAISNAVYTTGQSYGYTKGAQDTTNERDMVFADSVAAELGTLTGSVKDGYVLSHTIVVSA